MTKKKIFREKINEAIAFYDKGEWSKAIDLLSPLLKENISLKVRREVLMHLGWNFWKSGDKAMASTTWEAALRAGSDEVTKASAHAGLGIYFADKGDRDQALHHSRLAQELLPKNATMNQRINLNACGISLAKIGELERAKEVLLKVVKLNQELEKSQDPAIAKKARHQLGKNYYNLSSLIHIKQGKLDEAFDDLMNQVIPRYIAVGAETDLAAAYHQVAVIHEDRGNYDKALEFEEKSKAIWDKHIKDDPVRSETAYKNIVRIKGKMVYINIGQKQEMSDLPKEVSERDKKK